MNVLFVCLGNSCRSPAAEAVCRTLAQQRGLDKKITCDSAGTSGYHVGEDADPRMRAAAARRGIMITHTARKVRSADFRDFDLIFAMDDQNYEDLVRLSPDDQVHKIRMFREFDPQGPGDVPDPWFGGDSGFEVVMDMLQRGCESFLDQVEQEHWVS